MHKIIAIGDIHGIDTWQKAVKDTTFDVCVFVGDYFDSFDLEADVQIANFKDIVSFKRKMGDKVVLLTGNHDLHYLLEGEQYSGFQPYQKVDIKEALLAAGDVLKRAYTADGFLFSHAGVTKTWAGANEVDLSDTVASINKLPLQAFAFNETCDKSYYGEHKSQGPMWVRPTSLKEDAIEGYIQIVGHTRNRFIEVEDKFVFIDSLWNGEFLSIEDDVIIVNKIV